MAFGSLTNPADCTGGLSISEQGSECMNIKIPLIIFISAFSLTIVGSIISNILVSSGTFIDPKIGPDGLSLWHLIYFALFCVMGFSIIPLAVHLFIFMQVKIGNGEFFFVRFFRENERAIVYGCWIMMIIGFAIIFSLGKDDVLSDFK
jgi:hypothetical protein